MSIPRKVIDWQAYDKHHQEGGTDAAFARSYEISPSNFPKYKNARHMDEVTQTKHPSTQTKPAAVTIEDVPLEDINPNGNLPAIPSAQPIASQRISALPVHSDASELDDVRSRLATLEAFMSALQEQQRISALPVHQNAPAHRSAPERIEPPQWVSRGMHVSTDMLAAIDAYATQRRLEKRMALDELLRIAFAAVAEEVGSDE